MAAKKEKITIRRADGSGFVMNRADAEKFMSANAGYVIDGQPEPETESKAVDQTETEDKAVQSPRRSRS